MVIAAQWFPYTLPLVQPWRSAAGHVDVRSGRLLRLLSDDGLIGWGDASPLPEFGIDENLAIAYAEETAHLDLAAQRVGMPLHVWASGSGSSGRIAVNASLGALVSIEGDKLLGAVKSGYSVIKLKVGVAPLAEEITRIQELSASLDRVSQLRLDANRAWSAKEARMFIDACAGLPIECLEEPLAEPTAKMLYTLQSAASFPLALDESIELLDDSFLMAPPVRRIVLKPARLGWLGSYELGLRLINAGCEIVVTSALESTCGILASAHMAAALNPYATHGLATGGWLFDDTGSGPIYGHGHLQLPDAAGLGFVPAKCYQSADSSI